MRRYIAIMILGLVALGALLALPVQAQEGGPRLSGPFTHQNLTIWLVHGESAPGPAPLTLEEALASGAVVVRETGDVNELVIENTGDEPVFVQSGDIVKGGRQDRALTASLILPPKSGEIDIAAFCVEQGRWTGRGDEASDHFASSTEALPSREAKLALLAPEAAYDAAPGAIGRVAAGVQNAAVQGPLEAGLGGGAAAEPVQQQIAAPRSRQGDVWDQVAKVQAKLEANVAAPVKAAASPTSLQLSIEHEAVAERREAYVEALAGAGRADGDVIGQVVVINGQVSSADLYPSNALFRKMWDKNLRASAVEALSRRDDAANAAAPSPEQVAAFLASVDGAAGEAQPVAAGNAVATRSTAEAFGFETQRDGAWVHKGYLAR